MPNSLSGLRLSVIIACFSRVISGCESGRAAHEPYYHLVEGASLQLQEGYIAARNFVGKVEAKQRVGLAFEFPGTVLNVWVDEGDTVSAGQALDPVTRTVPVRLALPESLQVVICYF